jgi:Na+/H+ antiporter NhaD/arsenite permease-like protein
LTDLDPSHAVAFLKVLVGSLANLIVADRAAAAGVPLSFRDHARAGVPITLFSMLFAAFCLWVGGFMPM